jgi:hypothetical protein
MTLSVNRAKSVLDYLRRRINGPLRYCDATQFTANSVSGVGESSAEAAGQRDGTEDSYYRAVRIRAWYRPNPPSPPECKSRTQPTVRRVISRTWNTVNTRMGGGGNPIHDGSAGALLGDLINKMIDVKKRGGSDTRRYHNYPTDYVIVRVYDEYTIDDHLYSGPVSTTTYKKVMRYEWGPRTLTVQLFKKQTIIHKGGTRRVTNTTESYSRDTIWEHTTAPDANVFG